MNIRWTFLAILCVAGCNRNIIPNEYTCNESLMRLSGELTCEERERFARGRVECVLANQGDCTSDNECVLASSATLCGGDCPSAIHTNHAETLVRAVESIDAEVCETFEDDGCPRIMVKCAETRSVCEEGRCAREVL